MGFEREERRGAFLPQLAPRRPQLAQAGAQPPEPAPLLDIQATAPSKEVAITGGLEQLSDRRFERGTTLVEQLTRQRCFGVIELRLCFSLVWTREREVPFARSCQAPHLGSPAAEGTATERGSEHERVEQRIALQHVAIEVGEGRDGCEIEMIFFRDEGQPEPQLSQSHRSRREVDAKQRAGEHIAFDCLHRTLAGGTTQCDELVQGAEQKRPRSRRGIEHGQPAEIGCGLWGDAFVYPAGGGCG